jgi:hypothetical protein
LLTVLVWSNELINWLLSGKVLEGAWVHLKKLTTKLFDSHLEGKIGENSSILLMDPADAQIGSLLK